MAVSVVELEAGFSEKTTKAKMEKKKGNILMNKYELGRLLGQGTFAKVYHARNLRSGQSVAIKVIDKEKVQQVGLIDQIKREISVMRLVRHPMWFSSLKSWPARPRFILPWSIGVYHRDIKPENLLVDENGNLKVSDFGLSALWESRGQDGLLHTTCGTPAYVAPEVINKKGYDGAKADTWSCGVVLYVLLAGFLPFHDTNLMEMYRKISKGDFKSPQWFPPEVRKLLSRILDPNPNTRISVDKIVENSWFKKGFKLVEAPLPPPDPNASILRDVQAAFASTTTDESAEGSSHKKTSTAGTSPMRPTCFNAFDIISLSPGFDLSAQTTGKIHQHKTSRNNCFKIRSDSRDREIQMHEERWDPEIAGSKEGRKGQLGIDAEIFEVTPSFYVVEMKKTAGDTLEYMEFCDHDLKPSLQDIVWTWQGSEQKHEQQPVAPEISCAQLQGRVQYRMARKFCKRDAAKCGSQNDQRQIDHYNTVK
ncbi:CBL-interacting protein kinase 20 [Prunus dulcis]|uniref:non-specific serine/threonine protein kinase n=1 Tax=Prunus dulcis TaxID=3755 RepID=A0A4Y1RAK3_PRUDU|nr:CBL-interacting protein kinase 20 [Prunus dulcis]